MLGNAYSSHTARFASAFADCGHTVHLASIRSAAISNVVVHTVRVGPEGGNKKRWALLSYIRLLLKVRRIARRIEPDVVHAHFSITHGAIATLTRLRPRVVSVWGSDLFGKDGGAGGIKRLINALVLPLADSVTVISEFMVGQAAAVAGPSVPVHQIHWGVDTSEFQPRTSERSDSEFRIGFVKTLKQKYGPEFLVDAMPRVLRSLPDARLVMAGEGPLFSELTKRSSSFSDKVEFVGRVPHGQVPALLRDLDVLVNPSIEDSETFGVVLLEAMATGVPVVATRVGGVPEVVEDGKTGILVPAEDSAVLADAIVYLATNPAYTKEIRARALEHARKHFGWAESVEKMLRVLESVVTHDDRNGATRR